MVEIERALRPAPMPRPKRPPPAARSSPTAWLRRNLFNGPYNTALTVLVGLALILILPDLLRWALLDAVWATDDPRTCRAATGACWAVVGKKRWVMLFGTFPYEEQWRAVLAVALMIGLAGTSAFRRFWSYRLLVAWVAALAVVLTLLLGGIFGLAPVSTHQWGGLPLTLLLFFGTVVCGLPTAILLALGRRSRLPVIKALSIGVIEIVRGTPLLVVLFMASLLFPLFVPEELTIDKVLRAQVALILFFGAYAAEIVRGGLQAIPDGQYEAADAIGLSYWQRTRRIILPQALRIVLPALMNDIIRAFKNTTFVSIIGLFDVLGATKAALEDLDWVLFAPEAYLFVFLLYFVFCFSMSKYSESVERELRKGRNF